MEKICANKKWTKQTIKLGTGKKVCTYMQFTHDRNKKF